MEAEIKLLQEITDYTPAEDCLDVDKILSVVVKRRKTIPTKCMEISKQITAFEILKLENAEVILDENKEKDKFKKLVKGFRRLQSFQFTSNDLREAEHKLGKIFKRTKELNKYLERRKSTK